MALDEWEKDPRVRSMRRVFAAIERRQAELLERMNIDRMERGLRSTRKAALLLFERTWAGAADRGVSLGEEDAVDLYIHCLAKVLHTRGMSAPSESLPDNGAVKKLMEEAR
ncbi:MAG TPA: hypothetical protein VLW86_02820 [Syntrophorhabdales bacterium]|nr:hypothetical protein [Syntrophorhabdales bacterium]